MRAKARAVVRLEAARRFALAAVVVAGSSCAREPLPPRGHLRVWIDTNAPVPGGAGRVAPLLDVVRIEVLTAAGAIVDVREIPLEAEALRQGLGFTIVPDGPSTPAARVHAIAWKASDGRGAPRPTESVEGWYVLPAAPEADAIDVTLRLDLETTGASVGTAQAPAPPFVGREPSQVGTWARAARVGCAGAAGDDEVCVPGGAFWMGHPRAEDLGVRSGGARRLVVVSPFFVDRHEVSVAAYRRDGKVFAGRWTGRYGGSDDKDYCTFTDEAGPHDDLPVNCVRWTYAREYCMSRGGDLPSEAELEYLASAFGASLYPWGEDPPSCADAVWGRGGGGNVGDIRAQPGPCRPAEGTARERSGSPEPVVRGDVGRDFVALEGGIVHDVVGNLAEWTRDVFASLDSDCWRPRAPNVLVDPTCVAASSPPPPSPTFGTRGAAFFYPRSFAVSAVRSGNVDGASLAVGFRCVRRGR
ncbi:MAG: SUMF1/EgtB/PvdO family nonheme iron enzyme [Deltaproteobacteria bacterium]|nr:SUMF1/EgtB/PvdO family nonheme iron enzyme [Deltaproteobacteria bacterium]